ncbi:MAG TPA: YihA family ribosome biogenesis GTP-binding protein [Bacteroidales bacterium]|nr:YihA family ribosome biogenesis GTP-binding protein [Bacteroidales bacterium]
MIIHSAEFTGSSPDYLKCPKPDKAEYAFIGRSNVGKSSLINALLNRKNLARTSGTPGKTRLINHFLVNASWYLVDLPGYGYARISKKEREKWEVMIRQYLINRPNLMHTFVLIDVRIEPKPIDIEFINWFGENQLPLKLVFTKADKLTRPALDRNMAAFKKALSAWWDELPEFFVTSAENGEGCEALLQFIASQNKQFQEWAAGG